MKNLYACIVLAFVAFVTGCASSAPLRPANDSSFQATPGYVPGPTGPALMAGPGGMPTGYPQTYAWLEKRVPGCETGPLAVKIMNHTTDYFVKLMVDGEELQVFGSQGPLPGFIPPQTAVWICLAKTGDVNFAGIAFVKRPVGPTGTYSLQEVTGDKGRFSFTLNLGPVAGAEPFHQVPFDQNTFFFN